MKTSRSLCLILRRDTGFGRNFALVHPLLFRKPWPFPSACWLQVLSLPVQQHRFCLQALDVHFPLVHLLLDATKKWLELSANLALWTSCCCCAWGLEVQGGKLSDPCFKQQHSGRFLAISQSHTHGHLLRSHLSEVLTTGSGTKHVYKLWFAAVWSIQSRCSYFDSEGLVRCWCTYVGFLSLLLPHPAFYLWSWMLSYPWLLPIFCLFPLAHIVLPCFVSLTSKQERDLTSCSLTEAANKTTFS